MAAEPRLSSYSSAIESWWQAFDNLSLSQDPLNANRYLFTGANPSNYLEIDGHLFIAGTGGGGGDRGSITVLPCWMRPGCSAGASLSTDLHPARELAGVEKDPPDFGAGGGGGGRIPPTTGKGKTTGKSGAGGGARRSGGSKGGGGSEPKPPSTPVGSRRSPLAEVKGNSPAVINGIRFSGHALDSMQYRGIPPSAVIDSLKRGVSGPGNTSITRAYYSPENHVTVVWSTNNRQVITARWGPPRWWTTP